MAYEQILSTLRGNLANLEQERADTMQRLASLDAERGILERNIAHYSGIKDLSQPASATAGKAISSETALPQSTLEESALAAQILAVYRRNN